MNHAMNVSIQPSAQSVTAASSKAQLAPVLRPHLLAIIGLLLLLVLWHFGVLWLQGSMPIASQLAPLPAFESLWHLLTQGQLNTHIGTSLRRVLIGLALALLSGVPIGLLVGRSALFEQTSTGAFQLLRMISPLSWMPVVVMLFGIGDAPIYFLLTFAAVWPIILNASAGVKSIDPQWVRLGASL